MKNAKRHCKELLMWLQEKVNRMVVKKPESTAERQRKLTFLLQVKVIVEQALAEEKITNTAFEQISSSTQLLTGTWQSL